MDLSKPKFPEIQNRDSNTHWRTFVVVDGLKHAKHEAQLIVGIVAPPLLLSPSKVAQGWLRVIENTAGLDSAACSFHCPSVYL